MPKSRHMSPLTRTPSAPSKEEIDGCCDLPPTYSELYPQHLQSQEEPSLHFRSRSEEKRHHNCRIVQTKVLGSDRERYVYMDEVSYRKHERNSRKLNSSKLPRTLDDINLYPTRQPQHSRQYPNHHLECFTHTKGGVLYAVPPKHHSRHHSKEPTEVEYAMIPSLPMGEAYQLIKNHMKKYPMTFARKYKSYDVVDVKTRFVWHYCISTTTETREVTHELKPYQASQHYTSSRDFKYKSAWDVPVNMPRDLKPRTMELPGTSSVVQCHKCCGQGKVKCNRCHGYGQNQCDDCHGVGHAAKTEQRPVMSPKYEGEIEYVTRSVQCHHCGGRGNKVCCFCHGCCKVECSKCNNTGKMVKFEQVTARWKVRTSHYLSETTLSEKLLKDAGGLPVFDEVTYDTSLEPINSRQCLNKEIQVVSEDLVARHKALDDGHFPRVQTHSVQLIPVYEVMMVKCGKKTQLGGRCLDTPKKQMVFNILGKKRLVLAPDCAVNNCNIL